MAFCGFAVHAAKSDYNLRGLRPPNPRGFFDRLKGGLPGRLFGLRDCNRLLYIFSHVLKGAFFQAGYLGLADADLLRHLHLGAALEKPKL